MSPTRRRQSDRRALFGAFLVAALLGVLAVPLMADRVLQPGESAVIDVDGQRTVFTAAQPTDQPPPPPPPPPIDGNVLTPASGWASVKAGTAYVLRDGVYKAPGRVGNNFRGCTFTAETRFGAVIQGSQGKVNYDGNNAGEVTWSGVVFQGGGTEKKFNDKAGVLLGVKDRLVDCIVEQMWGVGFSTNDDTLCQNVESRFNGSAAAGGIGDRWRIHGGYWHDCNQETKDTDGGGIKATRGDYWEVVGVRAENLLGVVVWADIKNAGYRVADCTATEIGTPSSSKPWLGNFFKAELDLEAPDGRRSVVEGNTVTRTHGPAFLIEESPNVTIRFNKGDVAYGNHGDKDTLHWRQNTRKDTEEKTGKKPPEAWWTKNCEAYGNAPVTPGTDFVIGTSGANVGVDLKKFTMTLGWLELWNNRMWDNEGAKFRNLK